MKRCPVCGVMMGDNVARCSMCKYDFQKASQGNNDEAAAEAKRILEQKQQDNIARAEAKRSEEEKRILEALEKLKRDYAAMEEQFETEKAKLDKEFTTYQKKKLAEAQAVQADFKALNDTLNVYKENIAVMEENIAASEAAGSKWLIVEQDQPSMGKSPMECVAMSMEYLKSIYGKTACKDCQEAAK